MQTKVLAPVFSFTLKHFVKLNLEYCSNFISKLFISIKQSINLFKIRCHFRDQNFG